MYEPFVFQVSENNKNITSDESDVLSTTSLNQPLFSLGFHSFLHKKRIPFESVMSKVCNKRIFSQIKEEADKTSILFRLKPKPMSQIKCLIPPNK